MLDGEKVHGMVNVYPEGVLRSKVSRLYCFIWLFLKLAFFSFAFCHVLFWLNGYGECALELYIHPLSTSIVSHH